MYQVGVTVASPRYHRFVPSYVVAFSLPLPLFLPFAQRLAPQVLARFQSKAQERQRNRYAAFVDARRVQKRVLNAWHIAVVQILVLRRWEGNAIGGGGWPAGRTNREVRTLECYCRNIYAHLCTFMRKTRATISDPRIRTDLAKNTRVPCVGGAQNFWINRMCSAACATINRTCGKHKQTIYLRIFTNNIWSYLLWPPVIMVQNSLCSTIDKDDGTAVTVR